MKELTPTPYIDNLLSDDEKISKITGHMTEILKTLGLDLADDSLKDTPKRVAKMWVTETMAGLNPDLFPRITVIENKMKVDEMVSIRGIKVMSVCEHHLATIHGFADVAYIPKDKIIGLSKINRVVDYYCRRPQVQERLTKQIADALTQVLGTDNVAVHINAKHYCVISRGVQDQNSTTTTTDLRGVFRSSQEVRAEFLRTIKD